MELLFLTSAFGLGLLFGIDSCSVTARYQACMDAVRNADVCAKVLDDRLLPLPTKEVIK